MLTIAGVGPGNPKYLTLDVILAMGQSKKILGFSRVARSLSSLNPNIIEINRVDEVLNFIKDGQDILLLASGDPNFYGIVEYIKSKGVEIKEVLPGLSSFQYFMAKLKKSWNNAQFLSLHGRGGDLSKVKNNRLTIILTDKEHSPSYISKELKRLEIKGKIYVGFNLSYEDETIFVKDIGDDIKNISSLAVVVIENEMD